MYTNLISYYHNVYEIFVFLCFVDTSRASTIPSSLNSDYNQDDSMSLIYNMDNSITMDDQPSMSMESQVLSDAPCPTNSIRFTHKYKEYSSTQQIGSHQGIHIEETIQNCSKYDQCFTQNGDLEIHQRIQYW